MKENSWKLYFIDPILVPLFEYIFYMKLVLGERWSMELGKNSLEWNEYESFLRNIDFDVIFLANELLNKIFHHIYYNLWVYWTIQPYLW